MKVHFNLDGFQLELSSLVSFFSMRCMVCVRWMVVMMRHQKRAGQPRAREKLKEKTRKFIEIMVF
jgi:hypothetical protein